MRTTAALLLIVPLLLTGCEAETPPTPETPTTTGPATTPPTTVPPETVSLTHSWRVGDTRAYQLEVRRRVVLATDGTPEGPLDDLPGSADMTVTASGIVELEVEEATEAGARLVLNGSLNVTSVEGRVDDEPVEDASGLSAFGDVVALPAEVLVDETGVVSTGERSSIARLVPDPLTAWTGFLGPVTPGEEVTMREEWSRRLDQPAGTGTVVQGTVTGTETLDGRQVVALEGESHVPAHQVDLSDFYRDFLAAFGEPGSEVDPRLVLAHEPRQERWAGRWDPEEGGLVTSNSTATVRMRVEGVAPDRDTGEEVAFGIRLEVEDGLEARSVPLPES